MILIRFYLIILLFVMAPEQASAHAEVLATSPQNGTVMPQSPDNFEIDFSEPVSLIRVQLLNSQRESLELTTPEIVNNVMSFSPVDTLPEGQYLMSFRVLSLDAHPVSGSVGFAVGEVPAPLPEFTRSDTTVLVLSRVNRTLQLISLLGGVGLVLFPLLFSIPVELDPVRQRFLNISIIGVALTSVSGLGLWGILLEGGDISSFVDPAVWSLAATTSLWTSFMLTIAGCMGIIMSKVLDPDLPPGKFSACLGALLMIISLGSSGHAAVATLLITPVFVIHALMGAIWIAALWLLFRIVSSVSNDHAMQALTLFSRRVTPVIGLLLLCALLLSWIQLGSMESIVSTDYGNLLTVKLGLVLLVLGIAAINRWRLTPALLTDNNASLSLRRSIGVEIILLVAVTGVTSILASTPPPSDITGTSRTLTVISRDQIELELTITPAVRGSNEVTLQFSRDDVIFEPVEVRMSWEQVVTEIEPVSQDAIVDDNGVFHIENMDLVLDGTWQLRVEALIDDFTRDRFETEVQID